LGVDDSVIAVGSCFAGELRTYLRRAGLESKRIFVPEGLNNTFALLDFLSWCVTGSTSGTGFRYDRAKSGRIRQWLPTEARERYAERLAEAGALVCTIGVAEVWEDRETGGVFWHGVPEQIYDADRHVSRLTTVDENVRNIRRIVALDQVMGEGREGVYYWPSFEIVKWAGSHVSWPAYGLDDGKSRHVTRRLVAE